MRVDAGFEEGDVIPAEFDSMIAKIIAHGRTRDEAVARLGGALSRASVLVRGGTSNRAFLQQIVGHPDFQAGTVDVGWIDRLVESGKQRSMANAEVALCHVAILAYEQDEAYERSQFLATAARGRPEVGLAVGHEVALRHLGACYRLHVLRLGPRSYRVEVDGCSLDVEVAQVTSHRRRLSVGPRTYDVLSAEQSGASLVEVDGIPHRVARDDGGTVRAPAPCMVVSVLVQAGDIVAADDALVVLEAMKMESVVRAEVDGRVREVVTRANEQVGAGKPLLVLEAVELADGAAPASRADFATLLVEAGSATVDHDGCAHELDELRSMVLGFDVAATRRGPGRAVPAGNRLSTRRSGAAGRTRSSACSSTSPPCSAATPTDDDDFGRSSTSEYLFTYLRDLARSDAACPGRSSISCSARCATTGSRAWNRRAALEQALYRIARSQRGMDQQVGSVLALLDRRLDHAAEYHDDASWRSLLDRIVAETRQRWPGVYDLAQELHYRTFDQTFLEEIRAEAYRQATEHVRALADDPGGPERARHIQALVDCSQPLKTALSAVVRRRCALAAAGPARGDDPAVLPRRHHRRPAHLRRRWPRRRRSRRAPWMGSRIHVVSTHVDADDLEGAAKAIATIIDDFDDGVDVFVDFYLWRAAPPADRDDFATRAQAHRRRHDAGAGPPSGHRALLALRRTGDERRPSRHLPSRT